MNRLTHLHTSPSHDAGGKRSRHTNLPHLRRSTKTRNGRVQAHLTNRQPTGRVCTDSHFSQITNTRRRMNGYEQTPFHTPPHDGGGKGTDSPACHIKMQDEWVHIRPPITSTHHIKTRSRMTGSRPTHRQHTSQPQNGHRLTLLTRQQTTQDD